MKGEQLLSVRSGRVVAVGRGVLAVFLVLSFLLAPPTTPFADRASSLLLVGNLVWAVLLLATSRHHLFAYRLLRFPAVLPAVDLTIFTTLLYLTSGANSPFFSPFVVLMLAATIQWGSRGATIMGLLTLLVFAPAGWQVFFGQDQDQQAAMSFVLRTGYTAVISVMLVAFGRHVERVVDELSRLSDPLSVDDGDAGPPIAECLRHALWVFGAARGIFLWEDADEPNASIGILDGGRFETRLLAPGGEDWVAPEAAEAVFLYHRGSNASVIRNGRGVMAGPVAPLARDLVAQADFERALVIPASTRSLTGWVFVFDHDGPANEDLAVGAMVSAQVSVALERWESARTRRAAVAAEDRVRLARDLHDGVLQFLAGARLHLDSLAGARALPEDAQARIAILREAVADEQRELRGFISTLRPARGDSARVMRPLGEELDQLAERLSRYWTIEVTAAVEPAGLSVSDSVSYDLGRIVRESVANAVRHGGARNVRVAATAAAERLTIRIDDDGRGFAFDGEFVADQFDPDGTSPRSLHERVRALDGRMQLSSSSKGASVMIDMPLKAA
ncbi:histidine kinase [Phenylobacterium sp.]|uniref:sensor histidine kinase n=1 Tax=Phenylobacterium sp. TaxID=1871053 RepID=UPI0025F509E7|nr:histidine kinase [Phenylobacterium sp.]